MKSCVYKTKFQFPLKYNPVCHLDTWGFLLQYVLMNEDYRLKITIRNNKILSKIESLGYVSENTDNKVWEYINKLNIFSRKIR